MIILRSFLNAYLHYGENRPNLDCWKNAKYIFCSFKCTVSARFSPNKPQDMGALSSQG